jgi:LemA protein
MLGISIIVVLLVFLLFFFVGLYNSLVRLRNQVKNAWSQIDVQLKRRHDLIPNLVETVKGYAAHEKETLQNVVDSRTKAMSAGTVQEKSTAENAFSGAISKFLLVVENYPELKANESFRLLMEELTSTENKISFSRQAYNDAVLFYNNKIEIMPSNIVAGMFNFKKEAFFEVGDKTERANPQVRF